MIGTLTRDMSASLVGSGENVQSSEYVYDHMGRLMTGSIEFVGKVGNKYDVSTSYNKAGGLESKVSSPDASAQVFSGTSPEMTYDLTYQYSGTKPHQLSEVISSQGVPYAMSFSYNASGSISEITDLMGVNHSSYYWGQEQWLCGVQNTQGIHHYVYDHAGERVMKSSITQTTVQLNDETINTVSTLEPYTLYVNPYYVVTAFSNADQRSKHYYMGTQRVATDIGVDYGMSPSPEQTERARGGNATTMTETTQGLETDQAPIQSLGYEQDLERVLLGLSGEIGVEDLSEALAPIERFYPDLSAGVNSGEGIESETPLYIGTRIMYWYHPDYVSNVDMVTDRSGEAYELFLYNAWGESLHHWASSSTNSWSSPYRLNSKELDSETGMHYYGARYHHPKLSVWMSVDPLAHNAPGWSPYNAMWNNPILNVDPDGRWAKEYDNIDDYKAENPNGNLDGGDGHWLKSDRENQTAVWDKANSVNLQKADGFNEYSTITQRTAFYGWYAGKIDQEGYETNWPGAAFIVAGQMSNLDNSVIGWWVGADVVKFGNAGNKAIFDDVFDDLTALYNGPALKGQAALNWDNATLYNEQFNVVQPIYERQSAATISTLTKMAKGHGWFQGSWTPYNIGVTGALRFEGNIMNPQDRFNHGAGKVTDFFKLQKTYWKLGW
jgi:RHS repeat-associated protein